MSSPAEAVAQAPVAPSDPDAVFVPSTCPNADLLSSYKLTDMLEEFRKRVARNTLRTTFLHYLAELPTDPSASASRRGVPLRPRCRAGSLVEIARAGVSEDVRVLEDFDEGVLREGLRLKEGGKVEMPKWLEVEQKVGGEDRKRRKEREKKKRKKKRAKSSKRRREEKGEGVEGGRKKRKEDGGKAGK